MSPTRYARRLPPISEAAFTTNLLRLAGTLGYLAVHFRPARTLHGWATPMSGDIGFPDTVLIRPTDEHPTLWIAELKRDGEFPEPEQYGWLEALGRVGRVESRLWFPSELQDIADELR